MNYKNLLAYSSFRCAVALINIWLETQSKEIQFGSFRKLEYTQAHQATTQILPGYEIDTRPQHNYTQSPKGSPRTFLVKDFQHIGECSVKEKWIGAQSGSSLSNYKNTHTGAFKKGQQFYVDTINCLSSLEIEML